MKKKDLDIFVEALAMQFDNYIKYGEKELPTSVSSIYITLLDQYGNGTIDHANEKALLEAKKYFVIAVKSLASIKIEDDILTLKGPFENFFDSIYKAFKVYLAKCNHEGKELLNEIKEIFLNGEYPLADDYLKKTLELGARQIELVKEIHFTVYDNYSFVDKDLHIDIRLFDDSENEQILDEFKKLKFYPVNEIYFTEYITFRQEGRKENLIGIASQIAMITESILNSIQMNIDKNYELLLKVDKEIDTARRKFNCSQIQYILDGTYFLLTGKIHYASTIVPSFELKNGSIMYPGDEKIDNNENSLFRKKLGFEKNFELLFDWVNKLWKMSDYNDLIAEIYTFNRDNTYRHLLIPITSKARTYRQIRTLQQLTYVDGIKGFVYIANMVLNTFDSEDDEIKLHEMTSEQRLLRGEDLLVGYGYYENHTYSLSISKKDSIAGEKPKKQDLSLIMFTPLIASIFAFNKYIDEKEKQI